MNYSIEILKDKKKEIENEVTASDLHKTAKKILIDDIDKSIRTLEYEYLFKGMTEKQIDQYYGIRK